MELLWYIHTKNYITEKNPQNNHKNKYRKQIYQQPTNSETRKRENTFAKLCHIRFTVRAENWRKILSFTHVKNFLFLAKYLKF